MTRNWSQPSFLDILENHAVVSVDHKAKLVTELRNSCVFHEHKTEEEQVCCDETHEQDVRMAERRVRAVSVVYNSFAALEF